MTVALPAPGVRPRDERLGQTSIARKLLIRPEFGALVGAVVVWLLFMWQAGDVWLSWRGTATYVEVSARYGLTALAVALLMIGGEFDLSAGVMTGTAGMFTAIFAVHSGMPVPVAILASLAIAAMIGFANGYMVIKSGLPSFIVTLAMFFAMRGFNLWFTRTVTDVTNVEGIREEPGFDFGRRLFASDLFHLGGAGFKVAILWFVVLALVGAFVLTRTKVGNWVFAVGGNQDAARMVGVPATATKIGLFMAVSICGWLRGMVYLFDTGRSNVTEGIGVEFYFIVACVLGGCLLSGGFGSVIGAALGCMMLGMTQQGITLSGWDNNLYYLFLGIILLIAAFSNEAIRRWARTASKPPPADVEASAKDGAELAAATQAMVREGELP